MRYLTNFSDAPWLWSGNFTPFEQLLFVNDTVPGHNTVRNVVVGVILSALAFAACTGNILVVLSVFTNRRLRTVTNFYVVSLAISDLCVSILVMPLGIVVELTGKWLFGSILCEIWVSCDVMLCTASILNLCCISLDRYFAITKPLVYSTKRSKRLALSMIAVVWVAAVAITCPPIFGWQEEGRLDDTSFCTLTRDPGYIIYSSLGSFYVPLTVMVFVYIRIFIVAIKREKRLRPYKRNFVVESHRGKRKSHSTSGNQSDSTLSESVRLTCTREESREESRESDDTDEKTVETRLIRENGGSSSCKGSNMRRLQEGLIVNSTLAMRDISQTHNSHLHNSRSNGSPTRRKALLSHNTSANTYQKNLHRPTPVHHSPPRPRGRERQQTQINIRSTASSTSPMCNRRKLGQDGQMDYFAKRDEKRKERAALLKEHKAAKTLAIVVGGFVVCWLPFFLMYVIAPFCACHINPHMESFFTWLGYFNSVLNPGIYALYNRDFRHSFWKLTFGRCNKRQDPDQFS